MKIICKYNKAADIPGKSPYFKDYPTTIYYNLTVGKEYDVFALSFFKGNLCVLIYDDYGLSGLYTQEIFDFSVTHLPVTWFFGRDKTDTVSSFVLGYKEFVCNENHYIDLVEREPPAAVFLDKEKKLREQVITQYDTVKLLVTLADGYLEAGTLGMVKNISREGLHDVVFFDKDGNEIGPLCVPRMFLMLD